MPIAHLVRKRSVYVTRWLVRKLKGSPATASEPPAKIEGRKTCAEIDARDHDGPMVAPAKKVSLQMVKEWTSLAARCRGLSWRRPAS